MARWKLFGAVALSLVGLLVSAPPAGAQVCPGMSYNILPSQAIMSSMLAFMTMPGSLTLDLSPIPATGLMTGNCATVTGFGPNPPMSCRVTVQIFFGPMYYGAALRAVFNATGHNTPANGCTFRCPGVTCIVRGGDGLPVELMDFSVDSDGSAEATDSESAPDSEPDEAE